MDEESKPELIADFGLTIRPGDKLVIAFNRPLSMKDVDQIRQRCEYRLSGVDVVIVDDVAAIAAYRPEPT